MKVEEHTQWVGAIVTNLQALDRLEKRKWAGRQSRLPRSKMPQATVAVTEQFCR